MFPTRKELESLYTKGGLDRRFWWPGTGPRGAGVDLDGVTRDATMPRPGSSSYKFLWARKQTRPRRGQRQALTVEIQAKPYPCDICEVRFQTPVRLRTHTKTIAHSIKIGLGSDKIRQGVESAKPHVCIPCDFRAVSESKLLPQTDERPRRKGRHKPGRRCSKPSLKAHTSMFALPTANVSRKRSF